MAQENQHAQADQLIAQINSDIDAEIAQIQSEAQARAATTIRQAHERARQQMHQTVRELRQTRSSEVLREKARIATIRRELRQAENLAMISTGVPQVRAALVALWQDEGARKAWIDNMVEAAFAKLCARPDLCPWKIEHPADWDDADSKPLTQAITARTGHKPEWVPDPSLVAGLRIWGDGACLDGSVDSLLFDTQGVSASLLALLEASQDGVAS